MLKNLCSFCKTAHYSFLLLFLLLCIADASKCECPSKCNVITYKTSIIETIPAKAFQQALNISYKYDSEQKSFH